MSRRNVTLGAAVLAGLLSAVLYHASAQRVPVVVASRDLDTATALVESDVVTRSFPADAVPAGAVRGTGDAVGRFLRAPMAAGQLVLAASLADDAAVFTSGIVPPTGMRAIALPVTAATALGGALVPGVRVDVIAVPQSGKAPAGRGVELIASRSIVLDVRTENGQSVPARSRGALDRLGSIVIAIAPSEELRVAERIPSSTFVIALAPR